MNSGSAATTTDASETPAIAKSTRAAKMASAPSTRLLLDCVLASWDHAAFDPVAGEDVPGGSYYERSQPRIGHLLEEHLAARPPAAGPVRVCTLPPWLKPHYAHATGKAPTVTSKLDCEGLAKEALRVSYTCAQVDRKLTLPSGMITMTVYDFDTDPTAGTGVDCFVLQLTIIRLLILQRP